MVFQVSYWSNVSIGFRCAQLLAIWTGQRIGTLDPPSSSGGTLYCNCLWNLWVVTSPVDWFLPPRCNYIQPPIVHRYPTWDLMLVLQALTTSPFKPMGSVSLKFLSLKLVSIRRDLCIFHTNHVVLHLDPAKVSQSPFQAKKFVCFQFLVPVSGVTT